MQVESTIRSMLLPQIPQQLASQLLTSAPLHCLVLRRRVELSPHRRVLWRPGRRIRELRQHKHVIFGLEQPPAAIMELQIQHPVDVTSCGECQAIAGVDNLTGAGDVVGCREIADLHAVLGHHHVVPVSVLEVLCVSVHLRHHQRPALPLEDPAQPLAELQVPNSIHLHPLVDRNLIPAVKHQTSARIVVIRGPGPQFHVFFANDLIHPDPTIALHVDHGPIRARAFGCRHPPTAISTFQEDHPFSPQANLDHDGLTKSHAPMKPIVGESGGLSQIHPIHRHAYVIPSASFHQRWL
mmetsp:Transcript_27909/g.67102  ORF Transcript_27909/g.67102 Transcript_27909/m.67102 type:complete len:296 (-) Transcript_27909:706-1593(-)